MEIVVIAALDRVGAKEIKSKGRLWQGVSLRSPHKNSSFSRWGAQNHFTLMASLRVSNMQT